MRTYQSVSYGVLYFRKSHFTEEGWKALKTQLGTPKSKFNDPASTVDFETINVVFKTADFNGSIEDMTMGFYHKEGENPGWKKR